MSILSRRRWLRGGVALVGVGLLSGCAVFPSATQPSAANRPRIGYLALGRPGPDEDDEAFRDGLRELGYVEDSNVVVEWRFTERAEQVPELTAELVGLTVALIVAAGGAVNLVKDATHTVPIVMPASGDPVRQGLATSLARPGGNITGMTNQSASAVAQKRLQLLKELAPEISRIAVVWNADNIAKSIEFKEVQSAASALGLELQSVEVRAPGDFDSAFNTLAAANADALDALDESVIGSHFTEIAEFALTSRLPSISESRPFAAVGGLATYGPDARDLYRRAAMYVDKILKGANPGELPIEQPTKFDFAINLKTARTLGITVPPAVLAQATEFLQ